MTVLCIFFQCIKHVQININNYANEDITHSYNTRHQEYLRPKHSRVHFRLHLSRNSVNYYGIKVFHALPPDIKNLPLKKFLIKLKLILKKCIL